MKSMFTMSPFGGAQFAPAFAQPQPVRGPWLGQTPPAVTPPAEPTGESDILGLNSAIESLLNQLPAEALGAYRERWNGCKKQIADGGAVGLFTGGKCLYTLYGDLKKALVGGKPPTTLPLPPAQPSSFPIVPVAIAGIGSLMLIYGLTKL